MNPWVVVGISVAGALARRRAGRVDTETKKRRWSFIADALGGVSGSPVGGQGNADPKPGIDPSDILDQLLKIPEVRAFLKAELDDTETDAA